MGGQRILQILLDHIQKTVLNVKQREYKRLFLPLLRVFQPFFTYALLRGIIYLTNSRTTMSYLLFHGQSTKSLVLKLYYS